MNKAAFRFGSYFFAAVLISGVAWAGWIDNGLPLTDQLGPASAGKMASDGNSGAIIAFEVCDQGTPRIFAQRVDSLGNVLWGNPGIAICSAQGRQTQPQIVSDGAGGAIIIWTDERGGDKDIYAQHLDISGSILWASDGVPLCMATGNQYNSTSPYDHANVVADRAGGAIAIWQDSRISSDSYTYYALRIDADGAIHEGWTENGVAISTTDGNASLSMSSACIAADSSGGVIVAWINNVGYLNTDIYAQRINGEGIVDWTESGMPICSASGLQHAPQIVSDGVGGCIVAWTDVRIVGTSYIYAQRVNAAGAIQWAYNGTAVYTRAEHQGNKRIVSDNAEGAIILWSDCRVASGPTFIYEIFAQRVNSYGAIQWASNGVRISYLPEMQDYVKEFNAAPDGSGGAVIAWKDLGDSFDIYAQRVDADGGIHDGWNNQGVWTCGATKEQTLPRIIGDDAGGAIIGWWDGRMGDYTIYAQRLSGSSEILWPINGVPVCFVAGEQYTPSIVNDGAGGAIVAWKDSRNGNSDIYAQRVSLHGIFEWTSEGTGVCTAAGIQSNPRIVSDDAGGSIIAWEDSRSFTLIYLQRMNAAGTALWTADGVALCPGTVYQRFPAIISDGSGGAIVAWRNQNNSIVDIYAQRIDATGSIRWTAGGVVICAAAGVQEDPHITSDFAGGAIVTWVDSRSGTKDIYAQRIDASGAIQWTVDGVAICTAEQGQQLPAIVSDGSGGAIVVWSDSRAGLTNADLYVQRVVASGAVLWSDNGIAICTAAGNQNYPDIIGDGAGGAIIDWNDLRNGSQDIYAQRVNASGVPQWTVNGVALCTGRNWAEKAPIISDGMGGAVVAWRNGATGAGNIYSQHVDADGAGLWETNGIVVCDETGDQCYPVITTDGAGGEIIAWEDHRCGILTYTQRVESTGDIVATLLQACSADVEGESINIRWTLSELDSDAGFLVRRASAPDWDYLLLDEVTITRDGMSFSFTDNRCLSGGAYKYRVEYQTGVTANRVLFETDTITLPAPSVAMYQNHPNPFNPKTVIRFYLPEAQDISLNVYDVTGARVVCITDGHRERGFHQVTWDGLNNSGATCSSGVYFARLKAGKSVIVRKILIMR